MQIISILSLVAGLAATMASAKPLDTVIENVIPGMQYASHVKVAPAPDVMPLYRRGGGGGSTTPTPKPTKTSTTSAPATTTTGSAKYTNYPGKLVYNGGPVIPNVDVTPLWWGSGVQYTDKLPGFYAAVVDSAHYDMLQQYSTSDSSIIGRGTTKSPITLSGYPTKTALDNDKDIVPYLRSLVSSGVLNPTINTYYPIHFGPGISITNQGQGSCKVFCAYHGTIDVSDISGTKYLYYGIIPDQGGACAGGCGSSSNAFNNLCSVSSHELVEATTDPAVGVAQNVAAPLAWYDSKDGNSGGEIGDLCNGQQGTINGYTVQKEWSNKAGGCVVV
ncbi:hypothetical protein HDU76_004745 [Blyttiomyces sp. JEL0837]|nr:hypothetical protein HDU76_004745 [Blyttiomyces sp. JEL0837]